MKNSSVKFTKPTVPLKCPTRGHFTQVSSFVERTLCGRDWPVPHDLSHSIRTWARVMGAGHELGPRITWQKGPDLSFLEAYPVY